MLAEQKGSVGRVVNATFPVLVLLCAAFALGWHVAKPHLESPHEARVLESARAMAAGGSWIVPHFQGEARLQKPPLAYWLAGAAFVVAGEPSVAAARAVLVLLGIVTVLATASLGASLARRETGWIAAALLAGSWLFLDEFRRFTPDPVLTTFVAVAAAAAARAWRTEDGRVQAAFVVAVAASALALLAKGPIALLFIGLACVFTRPAERAWPWRAGLAGLGLASAPLIAWGLLVLAGEGGSLGVWVSELGRRLPGEGSQGRGPLLYARALVTSPLPATLLVLAALGPRVVQARAERAWLLAGLLALVLIPSRKDAYLLPLLPVAALLAARVLVPEEGPAVHPFRRAAARLHCALVPVAALVLVGWCASRAYALDPHDRALLLLPVLPALAAGWWWSKAGIRTRAAALAGLLAMAVVMGLQRSSTPKDLTRYHFGRLVREIAAPGDAFVQLGVRDPVIGFYAQRTPELVPAGAALPQPPEGGRQWILTTREEFLRRPGELGRELARGLSGVRQTRRHEVLPAGQAYVLSVRDP
jgi:4-amino-4-deoxy-L-arabinose transferase